jgi:hypothetical protein
MVNQSAQSTPVGEPTGLIPESDLFLRFLTIVIGVININLPERWGIVQFSEDPVNVTQIMQSNLHVGNKE